VTVVVLGLGNPLCGDDGAGPAVVAALPRLPGVRTVPRVSDPAELLDAWAGAELAVLVDAVGGPIPPGTVLRFTGEDGWPRGARRGGHTLDVAETVHLGQVLDRLPRRLVLIGIVGTDFEPGQGLSAAVAASIPVAVRTILAEGLWSRQVGQNDRFAESPEGVVYREEGAATRKER